MRKFLLFTMKEGLACQENAMASGNQILTEGQVWERIELDSKEINPSGWLVYEICSGAIPPLKRVNLKFTPGTPRYVVEATPGKKEII